MSFFIFIHLVRLMIFKYSKKDKLKSKKLIEQLFSEGQSLTAFPLRLVYLESDFDDDVNLKTGVSVSKKLHKTAVIRNKIKRLIREAYRLNKPHYFNTNTTSYAFMILYISKDMTTFSQMNTAMKQLFEKFIKKTSENEKIPE